MEKYDIHAARETIRRIREEVRQKMLDLLSDTCEEAPLECDITIGEESAYALSSLELPRVTALFKESSYIYVRIDECEEAEFMDLDTFDMLTVLEELQCISPSSN